MECTYSVFVLDDLVSGPGSAFGDGSTEWEPEISEPGDLVCPIVSSEYTSLEPIGKSGAFAVTTSLCCLGLLISLCYKGTTVQQALKLLVTKCHSSPSCGQRALII